MWTAPRRPAPCRCKLVHLPIPPTPHPPPLSARGPLQKTPIAFEISPTEAGQISPGRQSIRYILPAKARFVFLSWFLFPIFIFISCLSSFFFCLLWFHLLFFSLFHTLIFASFFIGVSFFFSSPFISPGILLLATPFTHAISCGLCPVGFGLIKTQCVITGCQQAVLRLGMLPHF